MGGASAAPPPEERRGGLLREDVVSIIAERRFSLAFQPVVQLSDRRVTTHEALLRLQPSSGVASVPTGAFVELAGGWGLGPALDEAVLGMAIDARSRSGAVPLTVNIAARSLQDTGFVERTLARIAGDRSDLSVEIMAADAVDDMAALAAGVAAFQTSGVRVCLDDLGGDAATLDCVRAVRFDQVKIAGSAVLAAAAGERGRRLIVALVALAATTGAETVAKLIETLPQAWQMQELGVRYGQGWLFGAPGKLPG